MGGWWVSLMLAEKFYYVVAIISTLVFVVQLVLNLIGIGVGDADVDVSSAHDALDATSAHDAMDASSVHDAGHGHSTGLGVISVKTVMAFLVGFGWTGAICLGGGMRLGFAIPLSIIVGAVLMLLVFWMLKVFYDLAEAGNVDTKNAVGKTATVYVSIPPAGQGRGQVQVTVQGRLREMNAVAQDEEALKPGTHVRVVKLLDAETVLVKKMEVRDV
jgi:hypothetical protein